MSIARIENKLEGVINALKAFSNCVAPTDIEIKLEEMYISLKELKEENTKLKADVEYLKDIDQLRDFNQSKLREQFYSLLEYTRRIDDTKINQIKDDFNEYIRETTRDFWNGCPDYKRIEKYRMN